MERNTQGHLPVGADQRDVTSPLVGVRADNGAGIDIPPARHTARCRENYSLDYIATDKSCTQTHIFFPSPPTCAREGARKFDRATGGVMTVLLESGCLYEVLEPKRCRHLH
jgi:hypothetical protein